MDCSAAKIMNPTYRHAQPISCVRSHKQTQASRPFEEKKSSGTFQVPWIENPGAGSSRHRPLNSDFRPPTSALLYIRLVSVQSVVKTGSVVRSSIHLITDYTDKYRILYTRDQRSAGGARFVVTCLTFEIRELEAPATLATDL